MRGGGAGRVVLIDGGVFLPDAAKLSVYDRGFVYGDAIFEVVRTYRGAPFALEEHFARLQRSAERVLLDLPFDFAGFKEEITRALASAGNAESYLRIIVTRGSGPLSLDPDTAGPPLRVVLVEPLVMPPRRTYVSGIAAATVVTRRATDLTAATGAKVTNYLESLLAVRAAKAVGAEEALIVDADGDVVEGATSNVFVVRGGRVATPPESAGILAGITRAHVLAVASSAGVAVSEERLRPDDLYAADEVFITSSVREIVPIVRVDGRTIGAAAPGTVARRLHRAFRAAVGLGNDPMPWET